MSRFQSVSLVAIDDREDCYALSGCDLRVRAVLSATPALSTFFTADQRFCSTQHLDIFFKGQKNTLVNSVMGG